MKKAVSAGELPGSEGGGPPAGAYAELRPGPEPGLEWRCSGAGAGPAGEIGSESGSAGRASPPWARPVGGAASLARGSPGEAEAPVGLDPDRARLVSSGSPRMALRRLESGDILRVVARSPPAARISSELGRTRLVSSWASAMAWGWGCSAPDRGLGLPLHPTTRRPHAPQKTASEGMLRWQWGQSMAKGTLSAAFSSVKEPTASVRERRNMGGLKAPGGCLPQGGPMPV